MSDKTTASINSFQTKYENKPSTQDVRTERKWCSLCNFIKYPSKIPKL